MKQITLIGRRWFNKTFGNTYHSVEIYVDGTYIHKVDYEYGYGNQWEYTAQEWLEKNGYMPAQKCRDWAYCDDRGIKLVRTVTDVPRKKDL